MARTVEEIYNSMIAEKQNAATLSGLMPQYQMNTPTPDNPFMDLADNVNSQSQVSVWQFWIYIVSCGIYLLEFLFDAFKADVQAMADASEYGTKMWYEQIAKAWQYGYSLTWDSALRRLYYIDTISPPAVASRLIAKVSVVEVNTPTFAGVAIKIAKNSGGVLVPLDTAAGTELDSFSNYIEQKKPAGIATSIINQPADLVRFHLRRFYDGTLILEDVKTADLATLTAFLQSIDFNGTLYLNSLIDRFQAMPQSKNPALTVLSCEVKAYTDTTWTSVTEMKEPASGYFSLVPIGTTIGTDTVIDYIAV
jgi:hypothetical protein